MSTTCYRVPVETYNVVIGHPKSLKMRCGEFIRSDFFRRVVLLGMLFVFLGIMFVCLGLVWVLAACQQQPGMNLEAMRISDIVVYQNSTASPWQVNSAFNIDLSTWNPNTVAGCFITFRRIIVRVEYRGQVILLQEVPLEFGLKPHDGVHAVSLEIKGNKFELMNLDLDPLLEKELQSNYFTLTFFFDAQYLQIDRKKEWQSYGCHVVAKTPSNSTQVGANSIVDMYCQYF